MHVSGDGHVVPPLFRLFVYLYAQSPFCQLLTNYGCYNRSSKRPKVDRLRVAQNSIEIITDPDLIPESLKFLAGKYFKRFDRETCIFVSNIKESYPDD